MDISSLAIFAAALLINSGTPGPSVAALVGRVMSRGARDVWPFLTAMWIGEGLWLAAAAFGLAVVAESFHTAFVFIKYCGAAYLAYLAWQMWTKSDVVQEKKITPRGRPAQMFLAGSAITLVFATTGSISRALCQAANPRAGTPTRIRMSSSTS